MKRIIKLLLIFVAFVLGIFVLSQWKDIVGSGSSDPRTNYVDVNEICKAIRNDWGKTSDWDQTLFRRHSDDINQKNKLKRFKTGGDFETAKNTLRESAANCVFNALFREFHDPDCSDKLISKNYSGVNILVAEFLMEDDPRIKKIRTTKLMYDKVTRFVNSKHLITADYDASDNSWVSFESQSKRIVAKAEEYRNNSIYRTHLNNIKRFVNGLSDTYVKKVVEEQSDGFYKSLSQQIINHFSEVELNEANLDCFNDAYNKYTLETDSGYALDIASALRDFRQRYEATMNTDNN